MPTATGHRKLLEQLQPTASPHVRQSGQQRGGAAGRDRPLPRHPLRPRACRKRRWCCSPTATRWRRRSRRSCSCTAASASATRSAASIMPFASSARRWSSSPARRASPTTRSRRTCALDLVTFARPVTKYAARAIHPGSLLRLSAPLHQDRGDAAVRPDVPRRAAGHPRPAERRAGAADGHPGDARRARAGADRARGGAAGRRREPGDHHGRRRGAFRRRRTSWRSWRRCWARASGARWRPRSIMPWTHPLYRGLTGHMFGASSRADRAGRRRRGHLRHLCVSRRVPAAGEPVPGRRQGHPHRPRTPTRSPRTIR